MRPLRIVCVVILAAIGGSAAAAGIENLLMPGKVSEAHAKLEDDCGQCHDRRNRARQSALCTACHKDIAADLQNSRGMHGRMPHAAEAECSACHSEHQGRDADIVKFNPATFDHALADFALTDAHAAVQCTRCHLPDKPYRAAANQCVDCHLERDAHAGKLGKDCGACHRATAWTQVGFDHSRTRFALGGEHASTPCSGCHAGNRFAGTPQQCVACHAADDIHSGSRGAACSNCHKTDSWQTARFDHATATGFALLGAHSQAQCQDCHRSGNFKTEIPRTCNGCHRADDAHATRLGLLCESCHANEAWQPARFDHLRDAHFALDGPHRELNCHRCHTGDVHQQKLGKQCGSCHRLDDVHAGTAGSDCQQCHGGDAWRPLVGFDHDFTAFPLVGLHIVVPCAGCHASLAFAGTTSDCNACHATQDVHRGSLGPKCADCHSPSGWNLWDFDHSRTRFALTGAHAAVQCSQCHREPARHIKLPTDCAACHQQNDVHLGQFGRQCQQCHTTTSFRGARRR